MAADNISFNYFIGGESEQFSFVKVPKLFFTSTKFESLSYGAKILYGLLLDRMSLSRKNKWLDEERRVYVIYTIEGICEDFHVSKTLAVRFLKELEAFGLIEKKRRPNAAAMIYVKNFVFSEDEEISVPEQQETLKKRGSPVYGNPEVHNMEVQKLEFRKSPEIQGSPFCGSPENRIPEFHIMESNKTDINNKDDDIVIHLKERIEFEKLTGESDIDRDTVDRLLNPVIELFKTNDSYCCIGNKKITIDEVRRRVLQNLSGTNFRLIYKNIQERGADKVYNLKAYVIACFYNFEQIKKTVRTRKAGTSNSFLNFAQNNYDFNELERKLLGVSQQEKSKITENGDR